MLALTWRVGDPRKWGCPVHDFHVRVGLNWYVQGLVRKPGFWALSTRFLFMGYTRVL